MSYEVLARKWRPQTFADVVGQAHIITTLQNQIRNGRVGHAYLFWGPRGTGKTTAARILAKAVNCTGHDPLANPEPCNQCTNCQEVSAGRSFDVLEMDAASNRGIDPIRELRENTQLAPATCRFKIYIIDEAHMLTPEAFNALLKTLEEPPTHVIFVLATTEHHKVPLAIVSRCQGFDFRFMDQDLVVDRLRQICQTEEIDVTDDGLALISHQSEGCLRDATNILERLTASIGKQLPVAEINQILGLGSTQLIEDLSELILAGNVADAIQTLAELSRVGTDLIQCLQQLISYFSDLRRVAIDSKLASLIQASPTEVERMLAQVGQVSAQRLSRILRILIQTHSEIKKNGYAQLLLESALVETCATTQSIRSLAEITDLLKELKELEKKIDQRGPICLPTNPINNEALSGEGAKPMQPPVTTDGSILSDLPSSAHIRTEDETVVLLNQSDVQDSSPDREKGKLSGNAVGTDSDRSSTDENQFEAKTVSTNQEDTSDSIARNSHSVSEVVAFDSIWRQMLVDLQTHKRPAYELLKNADFIQIDPVGSAPADNGDELGLYFQVALTRPVILLADGDKELVARLLKQRINQPVQLNFVRQQNGSPTNITSASDRNVRQASPASASAEDEEETAPRISTDSGLDSAEVSATTETPRSRQKQEKTPLMLQREVLQDKTLSPVLNMFDAKILKIEPK